MKLAWTPILEDAQQFGSPSTTLFYIYLVDNCPPFIETGINSGQIAEELGITNPYLHLRRIIEAGLGARVNNGSLGTTFTLLKDYSDSYE